MTYINLVVGDYSNDGHEKRETITIRSNKEADETKYAFDQENESVQLEQYCSDYEDHKFPSSLIRKYVSPELYTIDPTEEFVEIWPETFAEVWMGMARAGDPELVLSVEHVPEIYIGGYGLFY